MLTRRAVIAAVFASLVLAGCGAAEKLSPRVAVREAAQSTASQKEGTFRLTLVGSEEGLNALFNGGAPLTDEDRQGLALVRDGHIALSTASGRFGLDVKAGDLDHAFELRVIDNKLYARADVAGIARLAGTSPDEIAAGIEEMAAQEGFGFLRDAVAGKWLVADLSAFGDLTKGYGKLIEGLTGAESTPSSSAPVPDLATFKAIKDAIGKALTEDVSITEHKSDDVGDHYTATVSSLRSFYAKVQPALQQAMGSLPLPADGPLPAASEVPDRPASLDVWVKDGRVARLQLPLAQFDPAAPASDVALRVDIDREAAALTAPPDAVSVDIAGIIGKYIRQFGEMFNQFGGAGGSGGYEYD
jgi:hypothetical protein